MKRLVFLLCFFIIFLFSSCEKIEVVEKGYCDYQAYGSLEHITNYADIIVEGKVLKQDVQELDVGIKGTVITIKDDGTTFPPYTANSSSYDIFTVSTIKVLESYKGSLKKDDVIEVKQSGGLYKGKKYVWSDIKFIKNNKNYIMFLSDSLMENIPYYFMNPTQSYYLTSKNIVKTSNSADTPDYNFNIVIKNDMEKQVFKDKVKYFVENPNEKYKKNKNIIIPNE